MHDTSVKFSKNKCFNVFKNRGHIILKIKNKREGGGSERVCVHWAIERRREAKQGTLGPVDCECEEDGFSSSIIKMEVSQID